MMKTTLTTKIKNPLTLRQQKVVALVSGNVGKSRAQILRKAGYAPSVVDNPDHVFDSPVLKKALAPIIDRLSETQDNILTALSKKDFNKENALNLTTMMSMLNKAIELLSGRPTTRQEYILPEEEKLRLKELLEINRKDNI